MFTTAWKRGLGFALGAAVWGAAVGASCGAGEELAQAPGAEARQELTATVGGVAIDPNARTRVVVVGVSHGLGTMLVQVAMDRALRYRELYPADQLVFFATGEWGTEDALERQGLAQLGTQVEVITVDGVKQTQWLRAEELLAELDKLTAIASLDFFTHQSPHAVRLEEDGFRDRWFGKSDQAVEVLADNFTPDAYVTLNGCNGGLMMAERLSLLWRVPVAGALTGSSFQVLRTDGQFYYAYPGWFPSSLGIARTNDRSFTSPRACPNGVCRRMKPDDVNYKGRWGDNTQGGGLPFYKFFCSWGGDEADCKMRMARSLYAFTSVRPLGPSSTREEFEEVVLDWLCPADSRDLRQQCQAGVRTAVANGTHVYTAFRGGEPRCSLSACDLSVRCNSQGYCTTSRTVPNPQPTTTADEYVRFMEGFDLLQQAH